MTDLLARSVIELAAAIRSGDVRVEEVVAAHLEVILGGDALEAWVHVDPDIALLQARELDALDRPRGPLHGVPVGVKDIVDTADQPTQHGSPIHAGNRPARDATLVRRLREAGAVIIGKTVTTELALFRPGPTRNPHDPQRTPGGSSSGSAAAVAAHHVPLAVGTQTAGSVVRPAAFCGVVGAKPTFDAIPRDGVKPVADSLDTVGAFGRGVEDVALALGVMADDPDRFVPMPSSPLRVGFCRTPWWEAVEPGAAAVIETGVDRLVAGLDVVEVVLPDGFDGLVDAQRAVMGAEVLDALAWEIDQHPQRLSAELTAELESCRRVAAGRQEGLALRDACRAGLGAVFAGVDVLLAPAVLGEAPPITTTGDPLLCRPWTLLGTPTVAVPGLVGPAGLPLGVQVVGPIGDEGVTLGAASRIGALLGAGSPMG